jgi:archaellum biogenesis ATPase FlaH
MSKAEPLAVMSNLALAADGQDPDEPPFSAEELGIDLEGLDLQVPEEGEDASSEPSEGSPELTLIGAEPEGDGPSHLTEVAGIMKEIEEVAPRLPFLLAQEGGGDILLFARSRFLPTVRIKLKKAQDGSVVDLRPALPRASAAPDAGPASVIDFSQEQDMESLLGKLGLDRSGPALAHDRAQEEPSTVHIIAPGSLVLVEGPDPLPVNKVADELANALLGEKRTLTYVSTRRELREVLDSMLPDPASMSRAMKDMRLLVVPVFPIIRGTKEPKAPLLEKLTGAPQLYGNDTLVINQMTDFLEPGMGDLEALGIWPFLRKLTTSGKVVILATGCEHPAVTAVRSACSMHLRVAKGDRDRPIVQVSKFPAARPEVVALATFLLKANGEMSVQLQSQSGP